MVRSNIKGVPVVAFVGRSNSGKTTLLEKLISTLAQHNYRVAVVKHTQHRMVETDIPGKDTRRLWDAGAAHTSLITPDRVVHTHRHTEPPPLEAVLAEISDVDLIILEGYKSGPYPKIEVIRLERDSNLIPGLEGRIACVTDVPCLSCDVPSFGLDEISAIGDFIEAVIMGKPGAALYAEVLDGTLGRN